MIERNGTEFVVVVVVVALLLDLQWLYRYGLFTSGNYWSAWRTLGCQSNVSHPFCYPNKKEGGKKKKKKKKKSTAVVVWLWICLVTAATASERRPIQCDRQSESYSLLSWGDLFLSFDCVCVCVCVCVSLLCVHTSTRHTTSHSHTITTTET